MNHKTEHMVKLMQSFMMFGKGGYDQGRYAKILLILKPLRSNNNLITNP